GNTLVDPQQQPIAAVPAGSKRQAVEDRVGSAQGAPVRQEKLHRPAEILRRDLGELGLDLLKGRKADLSFREPLPVFHPEPAEAAVAVVHKQRSRALRAGGKNLRRFVHTLSSLPAAPIA